MVACQAPLSMGFPRQKYWSGLPFPSLVDLPNPGIELTSPALQANSLSLAKLNALESEHRFSLATCKKLEGALIMFAAVDEQGPVLNREKSSAPGVRVGSSPHV